MPETLRSVVLAGGGTGGHIEPALAFAQCLRRHYPDVRVTCLGTPKGLETQIIPARGWDLELVPAYPLPRKANLDLVRTPVRMARATKATRKVLDSVSADVVVGFGGYVSVPAYLAAWRRHTPLVIHEKDTPPGVANRMGARLTKWIALGFEHQQEAGQSGEVVGVPLRPAIAQLDREATRDEARKFFDLDPDRPTLVVTGGSQGARTLNEATFGAAAALGAAGIQVLHIYGARNDEVVAPKDTGAPYVSVPFVERMELAYAAADLLLCRGGAMTCAEIFAVGLPAVYVPYPHGNGEQRRNALPVVRAGGGMLVEDSELTVSYVENIILPLLSNSAELAKMSAAAGRYGRRDGDEALLTLVEKAVAQAGAK
ncbi:undecaprenyldiphospho-muramoylpentapeptide beta-N-acetylglucosaminyltransferase [Fodinicola feengrottensis]|uniref:UDP-N-acetylglucosamine--N-acetylmuramyl-(pentapeptide) pyrophosphoryl-undecaprenol N-acetylglucosamine transferase n=1 Tax=Fodinicola feengrottensis TaxID=435914 RepID=A0ABP4TQQ4_9ACTN